MSGRWKKDKPLTVHPFHLFWSFIGGPFEGKYRNASVVHDFLCKVQKRPWRSVGLFIEYSTMPLAAVEPNKQKLK